MIIVYTKFKVKGWFFILGFLFFRGSWSVDTLQQNTTLLLKLERYGEHPRRYSICVCVIKIS